MPRQIVTSVRVDSPRNPPPAGEDVDVRAEEELKSKLNRVRSKSEAGELAKANRVALNEGLAPRSTQVEPVVLKSAAARATTKRALLGGLRNGNLAKACRFPHQVAIASCILQIRRHCPRGTALIAAPACFLFLRTFGSVSGESKLLVLAAATLAGCGEDGKGCRGRLMRRGARAKGG